MSVGEFQDKLQSVNIPRSLNSLTSSRTVSFIYTVSKGYLFPINSHDLTLFSVEVHLIMLASLMEFV